MKKTNIILYQMRFAKKNNFEMLSYNINELLNIFLDQQIKNGLYQIEICLKNFTYKSFK